MSELLFGMLERVDSWASNSEWIHPGSVHQQRVGFDRRRRVVQCVRVLGRLVLQLALIAQSPGAAVAEEAVQRRVSPSFPPRTAPSSHPTTLTDRAE